MFPKITAKDSSELLGVTLPSIHLSLKRNELSHQKSKNRVFFGHETARKLFNINFSKKVFVFQIVKGGTGKTSLAFNFAIRANLYGARVLCVDLDHQGNLTDFLGFNPANSPVMVDVLDEAYTFSDGIVNILPGLDLFPSRIDNSVLDNQLMVKKANLRRVYKNLFNTVKQKYDIFVVDCPPSLGHSVTAAALASDTIIAPVNPDPAAIKGLELTAKEISQAAKENDVRVNIRVVFNKFDKRTSLSHQTLQQLSAHPDFRNLLYSTYISSSQELPKSISLRESVFDNLKDSIIKTDIDLFVKEALELDKLLKEKESPSRKKSSSIKKENLKSKQTQKSK